MEKIAILRCLKSAENCTGALCLKVFNDRSAFFESYLGKDIQLVGFFTCNGCENIKFESESGMEEKLKRILSIGTDIIHIGMCCETRSSGTDKKRCEKIIEIANFFEKHRIKVVWGTHR